MPDYPHGTPSWVELSTPDADASASFYRELMGWSATNPSPPTPVEETGGYRMFEQDGKPVAGLMGSVLVEPMDVMDLGRMAFFGDPAGAAFGVWQPKALNGAALGWTAGRPQFDDAPESYTVWELDGHNVGGMMQMSDELFPPQAASPASSTRRERRLR